MNIFEPFVQGERNVYGSVGGLGIGLALVKIQRSFTAVRLRHLRRAGQGQHLTVCLPIERESDPDASTPKFLRPCAGQHMLAVDDNEKKSANSPPYLAHSATKSWLPTRRAQPVTN